MVSVVSMFPRLSGGGVTAQETGAREARIEAVIAAVLSVAMPDHEAARAQAHEVGEWSARIAQAIGGMLDPTQLRRIGILRDIDPASLAQIPELGDLAHAVEAYQRYAIEGDLDTDYNALIVAVADEFAQRIAPDECGSGQPASLALEVMLSRAEGALQPIVTALAKVMPAKDNCNVA